MFKRSTRHYLYRAMLAMIIAVPGYSLAIEPRVMAPGPGVEVDRRPDHVADRRPMDFSPELLRVRGDLAANLGTGHDVQFRGGVIDGLGNNFTWRGRVRDRHGLESPATLTVLGNRVSGSFYLEGDHYVLSTSRNGQTWLDRLDPRMTPPAHPPGGPAIEPLSFSVLANRVDLAAAPAPAESGQEAPDEETLANVNNAGAVFDIVLFYSRGAYQKRAEYADEAALRLAIRNAVDRTNTALADSHVPARMRLVGLFPTDLTEADESVDDLHNLRKDSRANELRDRYSADFASLVTANDDFCGWGFLSTFYTSDFSSPYTWASANGACLNGATLAHELGHNMGLRHDDLASPRTDEDGTPVSSIEPFAWGHYVDAEFRTIMAYGSSCGWTCRPLGQFSDPDITDPVSSLPTGQPDLANNAEVLRRYAPYVEQWRTPPVSLGEALGQTDGVVVSQGDAAWVAQNQQLWNNQPTVLSGPVFGEELTHLVWHQEHIAPTSLHFVTKAWAGNAAGELHIKADGEHVHAVTGLDAHWRDVTVEIPAGTHKITWEWRGTGIENVDAVGQAMLADVRAMAEPVTISGRVLNGRAEPVSAATVTASADPEGTEVRGQGTTDGEGRFLFQADNMPTPTAYFRATGEGVETLTVPQDEVGCLGSEYLCAITVSGEARTLSGELTGAVPGESLDLALRSTGSSSVMGATVVASESGQAEFAFSGLDALYEWGPLALASSGYEPVALPESLNLRTGNVTDWALELTPTTETVNATDDSATDDSATDDSATDNSATDNSATDDSGPDDSSGADTAGQTPSGNWFSGCAIGAASAGFDPVMPLLLLGGLLGFFRRRSTPAPHCTLREPV